MLQSKTDVQKDPFLLLGYGVNAYFASMLHMAKMFAMVTLFCLPIYAVYSKNEAKAFEGGSMYALNQFTLGNLGGASVQCFT